MRIIHRNASALLFEKVSALGQMHHSWRCIYINLAGRRMRHREMLHTYFIIKGIADILADDEGYVYLCKDGDIFILFQGLVRPILGKLAAHFGDLEPGAALERKEDAPFLLYDLSKDWRVFLSLCRTKSLISQTWDEMPGYSFYKYADALAAEIPQE